MDSICPDIDRSSKPCSHFIQGGYCKHKQHFGCVEYIRRKNPLLSSSSIGKYIRCRRNFYLANVLGLKSLSPRPSMIAGTIMHEFLAGIHEADDERRAEWQMSAQAMYMEQVSANTNKDGKVDLHKDIEMIPAVIAGYKQTPAVTLTGRTELWGAVINDQMHLRAKIDLITNDRKKIYDYKFTGNSDFYTHFTTRIQAGIYLLVWPEAETITYRIIQKPALRQGKNETKEEFLRRITEDIAKRHKHYIQDRTFYRSEYDFTYIKQYISNISAEIRENIDLGETLFFQEDSGCWCYNSWCEYLPICQSKANPFSLTDLYTKREVTDVGFEED